MHLHILGICGTFMGGIAALAKAQGHKVTGSDANVYPPMSTQLEALDIELIQGFDPAQFTPRPDIVVIGNAMSRGNPAVEYVLEHNLPYTSGPQWLLENVLQSRWVLAVAGTHGKTSTASMLAWILEYAGMQPGYLIGGIPQNFSQSARLGGSDFFVIEADEYDSAFFDKRSKFVHYHPRTLVLNNLEFDHADIFDNLAAIQRQFHHLMRTLPGNGLAILPEADTALQQVLEMGCWTPTQQLGQDWTIGEHSADGSEFAVCLAGEEQGQVRWDLLGQHNMHNGIMAIAAARHVGVTPAVSIAALGEFKNAKKRMEVRGQVNGITVYDDFAHHPTAIATTLQGLRARVGKARILAVLEPRSNTMKMGVHQHTLADSWQAADCSFVYQPDAVSWAMDELVTRSQVPTQLHQSMVQLVQAIVNTVQPGDHILVMSNGAFGGIHQQLLDQLGQD